MKGQPWPTPLYTHHPDSNTPPTEDLSPQRRLYLELGEIVSTSDSRHDGTPRLQKNEVGTGTQRHIPSTVITVR